MWCSVFGMQSVLFGNLLLIVEWLYDEVCYDVSQWCWMVGVVQVNNVLLFVVLSVVLVGFGGMVNFVSVDGSLCDYLFVWFGKKVGCIEYLLCGVYLLQDKGLFVIVQVVVDVNICVSVDVVFIYVFFDSQFEYWMVGFGICIDVVVCVCF